MVISNEETHSNFSEWDDYSSHAFETVDAAFEKFKKSAQKEVNYLVKEFECKKAADSYARATTARTGVLDCSKLHTYKYNEDLFRKVTTLAEGKSHGLMFLLDWSGSMGQVMEDTLKQLYNLMWFCKKVNIPFDVYAFTNDYPWKKEEYQFCRGSYVPKEGVMMIPDWCSLMHLFTHKTKLKDLELQMLNMFRCAWTFRRYAEYRVPIGLHLSGTPLNESLVAFNAILPKFKQENKVQKVQCVILTDGEGMGNKFHKTVQRHWESEPYLGVRSFGENCYLRNRKNGKTYHIGNSWWEVTDTFLRMMEIVILIPTSLVFVFLKVATLIVLCVVILTLKTSSNCKRFGRKNAPSPFTTLGIVLTSHSLQLHFLVMLTLMLMKVQANQKSNLLSSNLLKVRR